MWLIAMFDLPTKTRQERKRYTQFRKKLLSEGFQKMQYSVYARYCDDERRTEMFRRRLEKELPPAGEVRLLAVTDRQYAKMEVFFGKARKPTEEPPAQLLLFSGGWRVSGLWVGGYGRSIVSERPFPRSHN